MGRAHVRLVLVPNVVSLICPLSHWHVKPWLSITLVPP